MRKFQIGVIGSAGPEEYQFKKPNKKIYEVASEVGKKIAEKGAVLICGGKGGIMESACKGAKQEDGITIGVISGNERNQANDYVDVEVVSGFVNCGEEGIIISMSDALIIIGGGAGTLQEITLGYRNKKIMVAIEDTGGWADKLIDTYLDERKLIKIKKVKNPQEAINYIFRKLKVT